MHQRHSLVRDSLDLLAYFSGTAGAAAGEQRHSLPCHSWSMPRIKRAQSNSTEPAGNRVRSSKKLDATRSTARGSTCQLKLRSSNLSNSPGLPVTEQPKAPRSKKFESSRTEPNTYVLG